MQKPLDRTLITVHFHGEFLDGHISNSGDPLNGEVTDFWNADAILFVTNAEVGMAMSGVSSEGWREMKAATGTLGETIAMNHTYRVSAVRIENGTMVVDVQHEFGS